MLLFPAVSLSHFPNQSLLLVELQLTDIVVISGVTLPRAPPVVTFPHRLRATEGFVLLPVGEARVIARAGGTPNAATDVITQANPRIHCVWQRNIFNVEMYF